MFLGWGIPTTMYQGGTPTPIPLTPNSDTWWLDLELCRDTPISSDIWWLDAELHRGYPQQQLQLTPPNRK